MAKARDLPEISTRRPRRAKPRVLLCTPEITELPEGMGNAANYIRAKGGGLGDVSAGLIHHLHESAEFDLHVVLPRYDEKIHQLRRITPLQLDTLVTILQRQGVHLVRDSAFSHLPEVYGDSPDHPRVRRAEAFQRHIINQLLDDLRPDIVHCNDWMTGLVPAAAAERGIKSLFTVHNVYTEKQTPQNLDRSGIDVRRFLERLYFEGFPHDDVHTWTVNTVDFLATGILAADLANTVSKTFLEEVVRGELEEVVPASIRAVLTRKVEEGTAFGILNAPNVTVDPRFGRHIVNFDSGSVSEGKAANKSLLQERMGLDPDPEAPLFFWPSRLYAQKGPGLLKAVAPLLVEAEGAQIALVASGDRSWVRKFRKQAAAHPGRIAYSPFREELSELARAAADFVLMPSRYEPCGLPQMEGPRFGTLPVARLTGGLRDTVTELDASARAGRGAGNGFVFEDFDEASLEAAMRRAAAFHRLPLEARQAQLRRVMAEGFEQFNQGVTAGRYIEAYDRLLSGR
jgi:starch synthase